MRRRSLVERDADRLCPLPARAWRLLGRVDGTCRPEVAYDDPLPFLEYAHGSVAIGSNTTHEAFVATIQADGTVTWTVVEE